MFMELSFLKKELKESELLEIIIGGICVKPVCQEMEYNDGGYIIVAVSTTKALIYK